MVDLTHDMQENALSVVLRVAHAGGQQVLGTVSFHFLGISDLGESFDYRVTGLRFPEVRVLLNNISRILYNTHNR